MSALTRWKRREQRYTSKYSAQVYDALMRQWRDAIRQYTTTGQFVLNEQPLEVVYRRMYSQISAAEAEITLLEMAEELPKTKDLISVIANLFARTNNTPAVRHIKDMMGQYFDVYVVQRLAEVTETTVRQVQEALRYVEEHNMSTADAIKYLLGRSKEINSTRSIRIARTESVTAANRAQLLAHEASIYEYSKAWLPVVDDVTRQGHRSMDSKHFIDLWDLFDVRSIEGVLEKMLAPGDVEASASNVVHCRCVLIYKLKRDSSGRPIKK